MNDYQQWVVKAASLGVANKGDHGSSIIGIHSNEQSLSNEELMRCL